MCKQESKHYSNKTVWPVNTAILKTLHQQVPTSTFLYTGGYLCIKVYLLME